MARRIPPVILVLLFVYFANGTSLPSFGQAQGQAARKVDEFGDVQLSDLKARLDNLSAQLQNEPSAKGFILVNRSRRDLPGLSYRYAQRSKDYLVNTRGVAKERVIAVDGGEADCLRQQLWIAPAGTAPPVPADAYPRTFVDTDSARKFDELSWGGDEQSSNVSADDLEAYAAALRAEPRARAYVIAYNGRSMRDPPGAARKVLTRVQSLLMKEFHFSSARIRLIEGGYREWATLELWILPRGAYPPVPTPNAFPPGRARRK
ncbi:MAG: hypothetical protein ABJC05_04400 [Pyrinomonadaceae bacterium]